MTKKIKDSSLETIAAGGDIVDFGLGNVGNGPSTGSGSTGGPRPSTRPAPNPDPLNPVGNVSQGSDDDIVDFGQ